MQTLEALTPEASGAWVPPLSVDDLGAVQRFGSCATVIWRRRLEAIGGIVEPRPPPLPSLAPRLRTAVPDTRCFPRPSSKATSWTHDGACDGGVGLRTKSKLLSDAMPSPRKLACSEQHVVHSFPVRDDDGS